ncbi:hypothetical protein CYMTET_19172 [Cymbomonas tetramitiformis]|uniref:Uncharacterized protein n=1 Tax=Cymbomonas tetramitiformis TaxID=36881 RepID=A0AAE0L5H9_9CHLO|nr:hypothetical protein CYMTET_19172 [Cymbomonas tetramitiformis]
MFCGQGQGHHQAWQTRLPLKTEFSTAGLDLASFDFDDPNKVELIPLVNELVYNVFLEVEVDTFGDGAPLSHHRDCSTDRDDGRRASGAWSTW